MFRRHVKPHAGRLVGELMRPSMKAERPVAAEAARRLCSVDQASVAEALCRVSAVERVARRL